MCSRNTKTGRGMRKCSEHGWPENSVDFLIAVKRHDCVKVPSSLDNMVKHASGAHGRQFVIELLPTHRLFRSGYWRDWIYLDESTRRGAKVSLKKKMWLQGWDTDDLII